MSAVAPSPPMPTTVILRFGSLPFLTRIFSPASTPEATAAAFSKATCSQGTVQAVSG